MCTVLYRMAEEAQTDKETSTFFRGVSHGLVWGNTFQGRENGHL